MSRSTTPVAILCGGRGTRMGAQSVPKGLVEIGGHPILWHVMKLYSSQGFDHFVFCLGYGAEQIIDEFSGDQPWEIDFVDTGLETMTGGRLKRLQERIDGTFMVTYQDGLARIDLNDLLSFHRSSGRLATITCARARIPFGLVSINDDGKVEGFAEKPSLDEWVNGGFFVFEPQVLDYIDGDQTDLEVEPFEALVKDGQMSAYQLRDFWACMDTYKDALMLNELWDAQAPWKIWDD